MKRYLYGWYMWARAIYKVRNKRHGAGPMKWKHAFKMADDTRYIIDGQFYDPPRCPRWRQNNKYLWLIYVATLDECGS